MKVISAHQPAYIPWLGFFHKILLSDEFVLMDDVQFEKNSFINRNRVLSKNGTIWLTIPVMTQGYKERTIRDMRVANDRWRFKHIKSLEQSYGKSPYFEEVMPLLVKTLSQSRPFLVDYTNPILLDVLDYLDIKTSITFASDLAIAERKLRYVIELTRKVGGTHFIFGKLGRSYADKETLHSADIETYFQDYQHPIYRQQHEPFTPYLSIVDALFMEGKNTLSIISSDNVDRSHLRTATPWANTD